MSGRGRFGCIAAGLIAVAVAYAVWYVFFRDIVTLPDQKPGPVTPAQSPFESFRGKWAASNAADWQVAGHLARLSAGVYGDTATMQKTLKEIGIENMKRIEAGSTVCDVAWQEDVMVIVFRGTVDVEDWIIDFNANVDATTDGGIHAGFSGAYGTIRERIRDLVTVQKPTYLWVTGHSLGGALAAVCARDLNSSNKNYPFGLMTFGQPMVATLALANVLHKTLDGRFVHFANHDDPVPRLPSFLYRHFGSLCMFDTFGVRRSWVVYQDNRNGVPQAKIVRDDLPPLSQKEVQDLQAALREEKKRQAVPNGGFQTTMPVLSAHYMAKYIQNVDKWVVGKDNAAVPAGGEAAAPAAGALPPDGK